MYFLLSSLALPYWQFCYFLHNQPPCFLGDPDFYFNWRKIALQCCVVFCCSAQFSSVAQSCPALCDPMDRSTPGLPVHHQLLQFTQTHVHRVSDAIQPSHPLLSPSPPAFNLSQHQGLFQWVSSSLYSEGTFSESLGSLCSALFDLTLLPMNPSCFDLPEFPYVSPWLKEPISSFWIPTSPLCLEIPSK